MKMIVTTPEGTTLVGTAETIIRVMMDSRMDKTYLSTEEYMEQIRRDSWRLFGRTICTEAPPGFPAEPGRQQDD